MGQAEVVGLLNQQMIIHSSMDMSGIGCYIFFFEAIDCDITVLKEEE
jgi:hypothetical protein